MSEKMPRVIVLSRNYSTGLGVVRSLGSANYPVDLIASVKKNGSSVIISSSKYVNSCVEVLSSKIQGDNGDDLINEIMKRKSSEKSVLFPTDDFTACVVAKNYDLLSPYFLMPCVLGDYPKTLIEAMDKSVQSEIASQVGLDTAREWLVDLRGDVVACDDITYPCFVKPLQSVNGSKAEMTVCNDAESLVSHLNKMKTFFSDRSVLIQEYLKIDKELDLSGVCIDDKIIIPAVIEKSRIAQFEPGVTMSGTMLDTSVLGDSKEKIVEMLKKFRYIGMFDMELFKCGDKIYFNEINLRSGGPNYSYYLNGANLPDIFVKELCGIGHRENEESVDAYGKTFVYEKVAWEDYIHSFITKKELKQCIASADFTLLEDANDPQPGKIFFKRIRLSAIKHRLMIALGKE